MIVQASTLTDENGDYRLFVEPNIYNLVAYKEGYAPRCKYIEVEPNSEYGDEDMILTSTSGEEGTLSCQVEDVDPGTEDTSVSISVQQSTVCEGGIGTTQIEIVSLNIADGGVYDISLPDGSYHVVAETEEGFKKFISNPDPNITNDDTYTLEISFEPKL